VKPQASSRITYPTSGNFGLAVDVGDDAGNVVGGTAVHGQPAFGVYLRDPVTDAGHAMGLFVVTLAGDRVSAITRFDNAVLFRFGFPGRLTETDNRCPDAGFSGSGPRFSPGGPGRSSPRTW
jgi:hypothetical protein